MSTPQERSQGDIWTHKCTPRLPNELQNDAKINAKHDFFQSGQCVSHTVNTMLFFALATAKCEQKHQKTHPATHTGTLVSQSLKHVTQMTPKYVPMDPQDPPL